jgi:methylmalonyl-CoA epimerase
MTDLSTSSSAGLPAHLVKRIDHVAIIVRSIDQALGFYRDLLGMQLSEIKTLPSEGVRIAFLPSGGPQGSEIELIEPTDQGTGVAQFLEKRGEGLHHICLETPDIDAALAYLTAQGARVLDSTPRLAAEGRAIFVHPKSANGVLLELVQRTR